MFQTDPTAIDRYVHYESRQIDRIADVIRLFPVECCTNVAQEVQNQTGQQKGGMLRT